MNNETNITNNLIEKIKRKEVITVKELLEANIPKKKYLIKKLVPKGDITVIAARPGELKSLTAMYGSCCCAIGKPFLGRDTQKIKILYLDEENNYPALSERFKKLTLGLEREPKDFENIKLLVFSAIKINTNEGREQLQQLVIKHSPDLVIIDCLIRVFTGDENSSKDMRLIFENLCQIIEKYGTTFLILHHVTKTKGRVTINAIRGSGDIIAAAASVLIINKNKQNNYSLSQVKSRHSAELENELIFELVDFETEEGRGLKFNFIREKELNKGNNTFALNAVENWCKENFTLNKGFKTGNVANFFPHLNGNDIRRILWELVKKNVLLSTGKGKWININPNSNKENVNKWRK